MSSHSVVHWTVSLASCSLTLVCPRCDAPRRFVFADTARVNAHRKRLDAWLLFLCSHCQRTHKVPLFERRTVGSVDPVLLDSLHRNDPQALQSLAAHVVGGDAFVVTGEVPAGPAEVRLAVAAGVRARLDRVLALGLGCSRKAAVDRLATSKGSRPAWDGQTVRLR